MAVVIREGRKDPPDITEVAHTEAAPDMSGWPGAGTPR